MITQIVLSLANVQTFCHFELQIAYEKKLHATRLYSHNFHLFNTFKLLRLFLIYFLLFYLQPALEKEMLTRNEKWTKSSKDKLTIVSNMEETTPRCKNISYEFICITWNLSDMKWQIAFFSYAHRLTEFNYNFFI